jgi:hypothetical protein
MIINDDAETPYNKGLIAFGNAARKFGYRLSDSSYGKKDRITFCKFFDIFYHIAYSGMLCGQYEIGCYNRKYVEEAKNVCRFMEEETGRQVVLNIPVD